MRIDVLTLFPGIFQGYLQQSILKRALDRGQVEIHLWDMRQWSTDKHHKVDDRPFGGGPGMILMPQPVFACVEHVRPQAEDAGLLVMLTPEGRRLDQTLVKELAAQRRLLLLCGRYEGFDERIRLGLSPLEISLGDFITSGGEAPAMVLIDAVVRLVPGVLGDRDSSVDESFGASGMLEYPQYTRPREFRGLRVPEVLLGGDHEAIAKWRRRQAMIRTRQRRPDLLQPAPPPTSRLSCEGDVAP